MRCPVCKTESFDRPVCPECGFSTILPTFINQVDAKEWMHSVVEPYRYQYWQRLPDFEIVDKTIVQYIGDGTDVVVPYGIEIIGENSFMDNDTVVNVFLPDTIKIIDLCAFDNTQLETIILPQGLERIGTLAFDNTNLRHIVIPGTCKVIEDEAFTCCMNLKSVILSPGVSTLQRLAFHCCSDLEYIFIPESLTQIGDGAFATQCITTRIVVDPRNAHYYFMDNCLIDKRSGSIVAGFLDDEECINIPGAHDVSSIGPWSFSGQETDTIVTIPDNIKAIGSSAFRNCGDLSIVIPKSIKKIGSQPFGATDCNIFCEASEKLQGWSPDWLGDGSKYLSSIKNVYWHDEWNNCPDMPIPVDELPF